MGRVGLVVVALACACNLISGASKLEPTLDEGTCAGADCLPDGGPRTTAVVSAMAWR